MQPRVEHQLLGVDDRQALPLHLEEERRLDDVDADRQVGDAGVREQPLDLARPPRPSARGRGDRAAQAEEAGPVVRSGTSHGEYCLWWLAAEPKSHSTGSRPRTSSA